LNRYASNAHSSRRLLPKLQCSRLLLEHQEFKPYLDWEYYRLDEISYCGISYFEIPAFFGVKSRVWLNSNVTLHFCEIVIEFSQIHLLLQMPNSTLPFPIPSRHKGTLVLIIPPSQHSPSLPSPWENLAPVVPPIVLASFNLCPHRQARDLSSSTMPPPINIANRGSRNPPCRLRGHWPQRCFPSNLQPTSSPWADAKRNVNVETKNFRLFSKPKKYLLHYSKSLFPGLGLYKYKNIDRTILLEIVIE
jgi:hypothetical protein